MLAAAAGASMGAAGLVGYRWIHRGNRVVRDRASSAPLSWRWRLSRPARLHRRLRRTCQLVSGLVPRRGWRRRQSPASAASRVASELVAEAVQLDERVVAAARLPAPWRVPALRELEADVCRLEHSAARLSNLTFSWVASGRPPAGLDAHDQLDALQLAYEEVAQVASRPFAVTVDPADSGGGARLSGLRGGHQAFQAPGRPTLVD